jgi:hypothetical protein
VSFCRGCWGQKNLVSYRACVGCGQTIDVKCTACQACARERPLRVAIVALEKRVQVLEAKEAEGVRQREQDWNASAVQQLLE